MKRLYLLLLLIVVATVSNGADRTGNIPTGLTQLSPSMAMTVTDAIDASQTVNFTIINKQKYLQHQTFTVTLDNQTGTTDVAITGYGKVNLADNYTQIGDPVTLSADGTATITSATPKNYNYLKVALVAGAGAQHSHITSFAVKTANVFDITSAGLVAMTSGATINGGIVAINASSNNATNINTGTTNAALNLGGGSGTVAINSSDWDITTTGVMTGIGAITSNGLITGSAGATLTGAAINLNASSNFVTNIGTGSTDAAVTIGGGSNTLAINTTSWDISTAGVVTGLTGITTSGNSVMGNIIRKHVPVAVNATATTSAANMLSGVITSTSAAATGITTPTATAIAALIPGCGQGTSFDLIIDNSGGASTVTLILDASIAIVATPIITGSGTLTLATGTTGKFSFYFISGTAARCFRVY